MTLKLKDYKLLFFLWMLTSSILAQYKVSGIVTNENSTPMNKVEVYDVSGGLLAVTNSKGLYEFTTNKKVINVYVYATDYELKEQNITLNSPENLINFTLASFSEELSEVVIQSQKRKVFELTRLKDVVETAIYAGKKTEVILVSESAANLASNNARQIYSQIAGLNIFENDDAGLQLNIGGRGLDPNRTSNFNTRQNGYDISADVLGYPESYYSPPAEALEEIQVVRGAASLQYGTQFGGLVNFVFKKPNPNKELEIITRNTIGSNGLFTNFTSVSGTKNKLSYYAYYNYKIGDGFRPNSEFESKNAFTHLGYQFNDNTKAAIEITYLDYLAQQAGGLTDTAFNENINQSNRTRNWFKIDWLLYNLKFAHKFSDKTNFTFSFFGLKASRKAVGFRGNPYPSGLNTNPVSEVDAPNSDGSFFYNRDVIIGEFNNWGFETRFLTKYNLLEKESVFLIGAKYYNADNSSEQGAGSKFSDPNFSTLNDEFTEYPNVSKFEYPNKNLAIFGENILRISDKLSVTPGFRFENIKTESSGSYFVRNYDGANNIIASEEFDDNRNFNRSFVLLGIGASYKPNSFIEFYGNISQNYRSVTFSDIRTTSPTFTIDEDITDEEGFTVDIGFRGKYQDILSYDLGVFNVNYNERIGNVIDDRANWLRTNVGDAIIYGIESYFEFNTLSLFQDISSDYLLKIGVNFAYIDSEYTNSIQNNVVGNKVEFIPDVNLKTMLKFAYKNFSGSFQYSYLSKQFTDSSNAVSLETGDLREGIIGEIPAYSVLDFSASYKYKFIKLEAGVNNLLNKTYFTRRATGYPGPGIIPSAPRTFYTTLAFKF